MPRPRKRKATNSISHLIEPCLFDKLDDFMLKKIFGLVPVSDWNKLSRTNKHNCKIVSLLWKGLRSINTSWFFTPRRGRLKLPLARLEALLDRVSKDCTKLESVVILGQIYSTDENLIIDHAGASGKPWLRQFSRPYELIKQFLVDRAGTLTQVALNGCFVDRPDQPIMTDREMVLMSADVNAELAPGFDALIHLRSLTLSRNHIVFKGVLAQIHPENLEEITLQNSYYDSASLAQLIRSAPKLAILDLPGGKVGLVSQCGLSPGLMEAIGQVPNLRKLMLPDYTRDNIASNVTTAYFEVLFNELNAMSLKHLDLCRNWYLKPQVWATLTRFTDLTYLAIDGHSLPSAHLQSVLCCLTNLEHLSISIGEVHGMKHTTVDGVVVQTIADHLKQLKVLILGTVKDLTDSQLELLASSLRNLVHLNFSAKVISPEVFVKLSTYLGLKLRTLDITLASRTIDNDNFVAFAHNTPYLRQLYLKGSFINDDALMAIRDNKCWQDLWSLHLANCNLSKLALPALCLELPRLTDVNSYQ